MSPPSRTSPTTPTGSTRVAGVIGDPITHSLSPAIHNAAFTSCDLDWVYVAFPAIGGAQAVDAMRSLGVAGLNVTMPFKEDAASACDELTPDAATLGAANTLVLRDDGSVLGDSTDGEGFVAALAEESVPVAGRSFLVLGAGGGARAVVLALARRGAAVTVAARRAEAAAQAAALISGVRALDFTDIPEVVEGYDVVVNATPLGMAGEEPPFDATQLGPHQFVADLVYHPAETPLLARARGSGARGANGLGMLVHQAARAFELWTGETAPLRVMWDAVRAAGG